MKSLFRGLLVLLLGIFIFANTGMVSAETLATTGTDMETTTIGEKTYYLIKTEDQLRSIGKDKYSMSDNYILDADISLTQEWIAIGNDETPFAGSFNGNGFTISNLKITNKAEKYIGLFGYVEEGTVYNVTLKNVDIDSAGGDKKHVGVVVALCLDGKVYDNVVIKASPAVLY